MLVKGVLFVRGKLTLFEDELLFEPIRGIDKLVGAEEMRFAVADLKEVEGDAQELMFVADCKGVEFRGRGAGYVLDRLDVLMQHREGLVPQDALFEEDERVLVQGPLESHINALLSARGTVTVTTHRFRFEPDGFFNRMVGASLAIDVPLSDVEAVEVVAVRRLLRVRFAGADHLYAGALVPVLYSRLLGLHFLGVGGAGDESPDLLAEWEVLLMKGPLGQAGSFLVSTRKLMFTVDGTLDSMIGLHTLAMPLANIDRLASKSGSGRGIAVTCDGESSVFDMPQADARLRDLFALLLQFRDEREPEINEPAGWTGEEAAAMLGKMAPDLVLAGDEQVLLIGPALQWMAEANVRRGALVVTTSRLFFVPATSAEKLFAEELQHLRRVPFGEELTSQLQLLAKRRHLRFGPRGGSFFIDRFWATIETVVGQVGTPEPLRDEGLPVEEQHSVTLEFLPRNLGEVKYITIKRDGRLIKRIDQGATLRQPDGLGIFYPGMPSSELEEGSELSFELAREDGIYRFTTTLLRIDTAQASSDEELEEGVDDVGADAGGRSLHVVRDDQFLLVVNYPEDLRFLNRRHGFRVPFDVLSRVRNLAPDEEGVLRGVGSWFRCTIDDLAVIGGSIRTPREIPVGAKLVIEIPLRDKVITVRGTCVRRDPDDGSGRPPLSGLQFDKLRLSDEDTLHLALTRRQRQSLPLRG